MWHRRTVMDIYGVRYVIDTSELPMGKSGVYETMIFRARKDGSIKDPNELFTKRYDSERSAEHGHEEVVRNAGAIIAAKLGASVIECQS